MYTHRPDLVTQLEQAKLVIKVLEMQVEFLREQLKQVTQDKEQD